jgi:2TM family of unknown function (DUF5676)
MIDVRALSWSLALFGATTFVVCVAYGLVAPPTLHMAGGLEVLLPGFVWLTPVGFLIGLIESFAYGAYAGLVFAPIYNRVQARLTPR